MNIVQIGMNQQQVPYKQIKEDESILRTFSQDIDETELVWHRDKRDRVIEPIGETDWQIQFENQLPTLITGQIFIPKEVYHRILKGTGNVTIKIVEY
jgi:hypothetical protein